MHGYAYYFAARALDTYYPEQTDSIFFYLDKALEMMEMESFVRKQEANSVMELKTYINTVRAKALFRTGKMPEAHKAMSEILPFLDELKNYKNLETPRHEAYQFMADYYEKVNRPGEALKYQKLLRKSEEQRYESDKIQAINEMSAKYEAEKKEMRIQNLIQKHKNTQRILWLTIGLSLALLLIFLLITLFNRLKRKNVEQKLYETALMAELRQNELEKIQSAQQELEQNPVENIIEKIAALITASIIEKNYKKAYLERLSKVDAKILGQAYQNSKIKITGMDMKYIICFVAEMDTKDISLLFNVEPASIHTVRYRIKKKFAKEDAFRTIL
jgi:acid phosphatase family membrane protein YuiD